MKTASMTTWIVTVIGLVWVGTSCDVAPTNDATPTNINDGDNTDNTLDTPLDGPADTPPDGPTVTAPAGGARAATGMQSSAECDEAQPGESFAVLSWTIAQEVGTEQRVQVTLRRDGFDGDDVDTSDSLAPDATSLVWDNLSGQAIHFWRVITLQGDDWIPGETADFEGPTCVTDIAPATEDVDESADDTTSEATDTDTQDDPPPSDPIDTEGQDDPPLSDSSDTPVSLVLLPSGGSDAASDLTSETGCDPEAFGAGQATLTWSPGAQNGSEQLVQVTIRRDGFDTGEFDISESLPGDQASLTWTKLSGQAIHHWRVLTRQGDAWAPSNTAQFEGPTCVVDMVPTKSNSDNSQSNAGPVDSDGDVEVVGTAEVVLVSSKGGRGAAVKLTVELGCDPVEHGRSIADLSWVRAENFGTEQRVQITIFRDGFERNALDSTGPLPPAQTSFSWSNLHGQAIHFWRVVTLHDDRWVASVVESFEAPTCVTDRGCDR